MPPAGPWLSTKDAAAQLGVTTWALYRLIDAGELPAYRFGRVMRLKVADVGRHLEASDGADERPDIDPYEWLSTDAAAKAIGVTLRTVYRLIDTGQLSAYKISRLIRVKALDVEAFIETSRGRRGVSGMSSAEGLPTDRTAVRVTYRPLPT